MTSTSSVADDQNLLLELRRVDIPSFGERSLDGPFRPADRARPGAAQLRGESRAHVMLSFAACRLREPAAPKCFQRLELRRERFGLGPPEERERVGHTAFELLCCHASGTAVALRNPLGQRRPRRSRVPAHGACRAGVPRRARRARWREASSRAGRLDHTSSCSGPTSSRSLARLSTSGPS